MFFTALKVINTHYTLHIYRMKNIDQVAMEFETRMDRSAPVAEKKNLQLHSSRSTRIKLAEQERHQVKTGIVHKTRINQRDITPAEWKKKKVTKEKQAKKPSHRSADRMSEF